MLRSYIDAPTFYNNTELSAGDINTHRENAILLQRAALRAPTTHIIHRKITNWEGKASGVSIWKGGFMWRIGVTTARFIVGGIKSSTAPRIKILFNDVEVYNQPFSTGTVTIDIDISARGYVDKDIITVKMFLISNNSSENITPNTIYVSDAFIFPLEGAMSTAWVSPSAITTVFSQTALNALSNAEDWLAERLSLVPYTHEQSLLYWQSQRNQVGLWPFFYASVTPTNGNTKLRIATYMNSRTNQSYYRVSINGHDFEYGPYGYGEAAGRYFNIDLVNDAGCTLGVTYQVVVYERITVPKTDDGTRLNSRLSLGEFKLSQGSDFTSPGFPSANLAPKSYHTFNELKDYINALVLAIIAIKTKIDSNPDTFNRARMFRGSLGIKPDQDEYWKNNFIARTFRRGDVLWVKGRGVTIKYGTQTLDIDDKEEKWDYKFEYEESLTSGDGVETKRFYLDQFEALYPGQVYFIYAEELYYAAEFLR